MATESQAVTFRHVGDIKTVPRSMSVLASVADVDYVGIFGDVGDGEVVSVSGPCQRMATNDSQRARDALIRIGALIR